MNYADASDEATARTEYDIEIAISNRKQPEETSAVCKNGDCGEPSITGTSYCCKECCEDAQKHAWAQKNRSVA